jgi:hypothetical protein
MYKIKFVQCVSHSILRKRGCLKSVKRETLMTHSEISNGFLLILLILNLFNITFELQALLRAKWGRKMNVDIKSFIIKILFRNSFKTTEKNHEIYSIFAGKPTSRQQD